MFSIKMSKRVDETCQQLNLQHVFSASHLRLALLISFLFHISCGAFSIYGNSHRWSLYKFNKLYQTPHPSLVTCSGRHLALFMGKGDGKKKRPKKSKNTSPGATTRNVGSGSANNAPITMTPQRVTTEINVPIRTQLRYARMRKEAMKASTNSFRATNVKRTKYRKSLDEEEEEAARAHRQKLRKEPDWDVILNNTLSSPLVIVDAYNIIHKWPRLKKWMSKGMLSKARNLLIDDLEELRRIKGWRIEVVFDGAGRSTQGPLGDNPGDSPRAPLKVTNGDAVAKAKVTSHGVRVVYSGIGESADAYIEARCTDAKLVTGGEITGRFIVASDDTMIRIAAQNAGGLAMSADRILDELRAVRSTQLHRVEVAVAKVNGQAVRPRQLQGTVMTNVFRRGNFIIEDKRKKKKETKVEKTKESSGKPRNVEEIMEGTKTMPSWAVVPKSS